MTDVALPAQSWLRADILVRALLSLLAAALVFALDINLPLTALLLIAAAVAAVYPRQAVLAWIGLAGTLIIPLYQYRTASVFFCTAYLALLMLGTVSDLMLNPRTWRPPNGLTMSLLALGLAAILSGVHGAFDYDPNVPGTHRFALMQVYASALLVLSVSATLVVAYRLDNARTALLIVIGVGVWCSLLTTLISSVIPAAAWNTMISSEAMALTYAVLLRWPPRSFVVRSLGAAFIVFGVITYLGVPLLAANHGQWVSSWLAIGVGLGLVTWLHFVKLRWRVLVPGAVVGLLALSPYISRAVTRAQQEGDFGRVRIWSDALRLMSMRPLLGVGSGNYSDYMERYALGHPYGSAHGNYQQIAAETGLVGIFAFLCVIGAALHLAWRQQRSSDPFISALGLGVLGAMGGQLSAAVVGDYLLPAYHNGGHTNICVTVYVWILVGILMATVSHPAAPPSPSATR